MEDKNTAWQAFASTGSIDKYLQYKEICRESDEPTQEVTANADQHRRTDSQGTRHW